MTTANQPDVLKPSAASGSARPRLSRIVLMLAGPVALALAVGYVYLHGGRYESTEDGYVQTARVEISADVPGRVTEIDVHDNQAVKKDDVLFRLDDAPLRIAVDQARAQLASAKLQIDILKANYRQRQAELTAATDTLKFRQSEFDREHRLFGSGIASQLQVDQTAHNLEEAGAQVLAVKQEISAVVANLGGNPDIVAERHPTVLQAQAALDRALLNLSYAVVKAPMDGIVTRVEQLQVGNYIAASSPVFALISPRDTWIEANFKEDQLTHMRVGQTAQVRIDSYPGKTFEARVASLSPGTGSVFSILPAENATGNWVKVVQRLPVRIELTHADPAFPLEGGLSSTVTVDTGYQRHLFASAQAQTTPP